MNTQPTDIKLTTPGEWIVTTSDKYVEEGEPTYIVVAKAETNQIIALLGAENDALYNEHLANAALISAAPDMLSALIAIQETLIDPAAEVDLMAVNEMINSIFAKLANEAGEEL